MSARILSLHFIRENPCRAPPRSGGRVATAFRPFVCFVCFVFFVVPSSLFADQAEAWATHYFTSIIGGRATPTQVLSSLSGA